MPTRLRRRALSAVLLAVLIAVGAWWLRARRSEAFGAGVPARHELVWFDDQGRITGRVPASAADYADIWFTRDERQAVAAVHAPDGELRLWQLDLETGTHARLADPPARVGPAGGASRLTHWSPAQLVFDISTPNDGRDIWAAPTDAPAQAAPYLAGPWPERDGQLSFNQRWMAYVSEEAGLPEVYVRTFPDPDAGRWLISLPGGGERPVWRADSLMIYYWAPGGRIMAVPLERGNRFVLPDNPRPWVTTPVEAPLPYAVTRNGRRILMALPVELP